MNFPRADILGSFSKNEKIYHKHTPQLKSMVSSLDKYRQILSSGAAVPQSLAKITAGTSLRSNLSIVPPGEPLTVYCALQISLVAKHV